MQRVFWREQKLRRTRWTRLSSNPPWPSWLNNKQVPFFTLDKNVMETNKPLGLGDSIAQSSSSSWRTLLNLPKRPRDFGWVTFRKTIFLWIKMWKIKCELERYHCKDPHLRIAEPENEEEEKDVVVGTYRFEPSQSKRGLTKYICIEIVYTI